MVLGFITADRWEMKSAETADIKVFLEHAQLQPSAVKEHIDIISAVGKTLDFKSEPNHTNIKNKLKYELTST